MRIRLSVAVSLLVVCANGAAQTGRTLPAFFDLTTNDDGSILYFGTELREKGTGEPLATRIYYWTSRTSPSVIQRVTNWAPDPNYPVLMSLRVTGDGANLAIVSKGASQYRTEIRRVGTPIFLPAIADLSHNGRYIVEYGGAFDPFLWDLYTSGRTVIGKAGEAAAVYRAADDGRAVVAPSPEAVIDPLARIVLHPAADPSQPNQTLIASDNVEAGRRWILGAYLGDRSSAPVAIANDAARAVFLNQTGAVPQLYVASPSGEWMQKLTSVPEGVAEVVLSGDGRYAFAVTGASRLLRIDTYSAAAEELIPATPTFKYGFPRTGATPGSVIGVPGRRIDLVFGRTTIPWVADGLYQIPWDLAPGYYPVRIESDSPFEYPADTINLVRVAASFYRGDDLKTLYFHGDWSGRVTAANPARPGEIVVGYMAGLGPVDQPQVVGVPAAADKLARITTPNFGCSPVEPQFVGLAPGMLGVYQLNLKVPADATGPILPVYCGFGSNLSYGEMPVTTAAPASAAPQPY